MWLIPRIDRVGGAHQLDPEAPLVAVVEEEEELLAPARPGPRHVAEPDPARRPCAPPEQRVRLTLERVLGRAVPGLAAQQAPPHTRVPYAARSRAAPPPLRP